MQFAARFQNRLEEFQHYLFRGAVEIEIRSLRDFPEFVETARARPFECEHLY
jgi:predicted sulfurtransferase